VTWLRALILAGAAVAATVGVMLFLWPRTPPPAAGSAAAGAEDAAERELSVEEVVRRGLPSVVAIVAEHQNGKASEGTGFVIDDRGVIATAWHVVTDSISVRIVLPDGRSVRPQRMIGPDDSRDLVLLVLPGQGLPALPLRSLGDVRVGEPVVAIGHPLGLHDSVSDGLVSGMRADDGGFTLIQTSAPISPGNSGGPLLDRQGRAIGVVSFKSAATAVEGLAFAVPASYLADLLENGPNITMNDFHARVLAGDAPPHAYAARRSASSPADVGAAAAFGGAWQDDDDGRRWLVLVPRDGGTLEGTLASLKQVPAGRGRTQVGFASREAFVLLLTGEGRWVSSTTRPWSCSGSSLQRGANGAWEQHDVHRECEAMTELEVVPGKTDRLELQRRDTPVPQRGTTAYYQACLTCLEGVPPTEVRMRFHRVSETAPWQ